MKKKQCLYCKGTSNLYYTDAKHRFPFCSPDCCAKFFVERSINPKNLLENEELDKEFVFNALELIKAYRSENRLNKQQEVVKEG